MGLVLSLLPVLWGQLQGAEETVRTIQQGKLPELRIKTHQHTGQGESRHAPQVGRQGQCHPGRSI